MGILLTRWAPVEEAPIHHVEVWFDHYTRVWTVQRMTVACDQIGHAEHAHAKSDAISTARSYGVPVHVYKNGNQLDRTIKP